MAIPNILPDQFLLPKVAHQFDPTGAVRDLPGMPRSIGLIAPNENKKKNKSGQWKEITTKNDLIREFPDCIVAHNMWLAAARNNLGGLPIYVSVGGKTLAGGGHMNITINATANAQGRSNGVLALYIGGQRFAIDVTTADHAAAIHTKLKAVLEKSDYISGVNDPATDSSKPETFATQSMQIYERWRGASSLDVRHSAAPGESLPGGVSLSIGEWNSSANTAHDLSSVIAGMQNLRITEIATAFTDDASLKTLEDELERRWSPMSAQDGQIVYTIRGTEGELATKLGARNSHQMHTICVTKDMTNPWETSAMAAAQIANHSAKDPAVPYTGIKLIGYQGGNDADQFIDTQKNALLNAGGSPLDIVNGEGFISRMVTNKTHMDNNKDVPDLSARNLNWIKTLSYYRWYCIWVFMTRYRGYKMAEYLENPIPGQKIMTKELGQEIMLMIYDKFCEQGLMQHPKHYKEHLIVEIDGRKGKLKIKDEPLLITQHYQTEITSAYVAGSL